MYYSSVIKTLAKTNLQVVPCYAFAFVLLKWQLPSHVKTVGILKALCVIWHGGLFKGGKKALKYHCAIPKFELWILTFDLALQQKHS